MKYLQLSKIHWQQLILLLVCFAVVSKVRAQIYDFKVENEEGVTIYYDVDGENATVTFGDEKYTGDVKIPSSVQFNGKTFHVIAIGEKAFYYCKSLESISIPTSVKAISDYAFYECSSLESLIIPTNVLNIGDNAFRFCSNLRTIIFPEGLSSIGEYAFNGCDKLSSIKLSSTVSEIGFSAFGHTPALTSITVDANNKRYDSRNNCNAIIETSTNTLVTGCKATKIPDNVTTIGDNAFYYCKFLESIDIPSSVAAISDYAFYECSSLESLIIPTNVLSIGDNAFRFCSNLRTIIFPEGLSSIGEYAFNGCDKLSSIKVSSTVSEIGFSAFGHTPALASITVDVNNKTYDSRNNCNAIIETSTNTLVTGCKATKIPNNVTTIGDNAFYYCKFLESIDIPSSVVAISDYAFYECSGLESLVIPANVYSIGNNAFNYCEGLIIIESLIKEPFEIGNYVFNQKTKNTATLKVPKGTKAIYMSTKGWEFANVVEESGGEDDNDDNNDGESNSGISLVVWAKDGSKVAIALSKKPKVTFTETDLQITGKNIDVTYALDNMIRFTYEKIDISAIKDITTEKVAFRFVGESLLFPALKANSTVSVYSLNGTLVFKKTVLAAGEYSFPISNLNTGVYLVSVNGLTYKIVKK